MVGYIDRRGEGGSHANGHKQKQVKGASEKMRFDPGVSLFFHFYLEDSQKETKGTKIFVVWDLGLNLCLLRYLLLKSFCECLNAWIGLFFQCDL